jgi:dimethylhistidine N-methyltransferase
MTRRGAKAPPAFAGAPGSDGIEAKIIKGLSQPHKTLPSAYLYDAHGSALFERITDLPEYYPTRTETTILAEQADQIAAETPAGTLLIEYGSGSSRKTEILLEALPSIAAYVPIDVSQAALAEACARLAGRFPKLRIVPVEGDFTAPLELPPDLAAYPRLGFFPGSTIGNFTSTEASTLLAGMARNLGTEGRLIIGVDLLKDASRLLAAYNDSAGVTAEFNLNLLVRLNREMGANFDLARFVHKAIFNEAEGRIEMRLVSLAAQTVTLGPNLFHFAEGEAIHTENSYKYSVPQFQALAARAGWHPRRVWTDADRLFSLHELTRGR